jgi:DegV family protein with EDD domain
MRIGLVVDSACDLPQSFIDEHKIVVMPITIRVGNIEFVDIRHPTATRQFYAKHLASAATGETAPLGVDEIKRMFLEQLVIDYDYVFCQTIASSRSPIYENATRAALGILSGYKPIRAKAGHQGPFALRVIDTQNLFSAQGLIAAETARMIAQGWSPHRIREELDRLLPQLYAYMLPSNLYHLRARAAKKGDRSVGWLQYALGSALDIKPLIRGHRNETKPVAKLRHYDEGVQRCFDFLIRRIREGLSAPALSLSYSGELSEVEAMPGYQRVREVAAEHSINVLVSTMSITGAINVGEGALTFAFCAPPQEFE